MTNCTKYEDLFAPLAAGELDKQASTEILAHIETCGECKQKYETALIVEKAFTAQIQPVPPGFAKSVALRISDIAEKQAVPSYGRIDLWWLAPWFAGIVTVIAIAFMVFKPTIPSYTQLIPRIVSNPLALAALAILITAGTISILSVALAGFFAYRNK